MSSPLPVCQYLVAFNNKAFDDPALITSVASPGTLGAVNVWTDITQFVTRHAFQRGRQHELDRFDTGTLTLDLGNRDGRFNPWNTSSPYTGKLVPNVPVQLRVTWNSVTYKRFTGLVEAWPVLWPDPVSGWATVVASDAFYAFNLANLTSSAYAATVIADGATSYWKLNEQNGASVAADTAGANPGTYVGTPIEGVSGPSLVSTDTAVQFGTLTSGAHGIGGVTIPAGSVAAGTSAFTIECWVNTRDVTQHAVTCNDLPYGTISGALIDFLKIGVGPAGAPRCDFTSLPNNIDGTKAINDGAWHHLVFTRDGSNHGILYSDGVQVATRTTTMNLVSNGGYIAQGTYSGGAAQYDFNGSIAGVAFYNGVALTPTKVLTHFQLGASAFQPEWSGQRIGHLLDIASWSSGARNVDTGTSIVQLNTQILTNTKVLTALQLVEQTEDGALFVDGAGKVRFISRANMLTSSTTANVQATFGDTINTEIPFEPGPDLALDTQDLWNEATVTANGGVQQQALNQASIDQYGRRTQNLVGLVHVSDADSLGHAQWIVTRLSTPLTRLRSIKVNLLDFLGATSQVASVLALELTYRVVVNRHGPPGGGTAFTQTALLERIEETVTPNSWDLTLALSPTDALNNYWILGTSALGTSTILAF